MENKYTTHPSRINSWAEEDRPREKLLLKGKSALSDVELLGILIGSGNRDMNALEISKYILNMVSHDLNELAKLSVADLEKVKGIGKAKAITIVSALELGRRRKEYLSIPRPKISCSSDVWQIVKPYLMDIAHEEFWILILNRANGVIKSEKVSSGGLSGTVADPKVIFKQVLDAKGSSLILVHNHPSGNLKPSEADLSLTRKLKEAGSLLELPVLDHIIFTDKSYFSFADEGLM